MQECKEQRCTVCSMRLCYETEQGTHEIIGHFNFNDKMYCVKCYRFNEPEIIRGEK